MVTAPVVAAEVKRWPSERPLLALCALAAAIIWLLAILSLIGVVYAVMLGAFFFLAQAAFVAHIRGSAVKLGPHQFPDLYQAVERLARRVGLDDVPDTYLMQAGGTLNAFATRFLGGDLVVLYADLLDACGDNTAARDMIIAHELGHVRAGHLRGHWFLLPAFLVPFLGTALSRAREYTCDRYGLAGAGDRDGALLGLTILAAGAQRAAAVDRRSLMEQAEDLNTGWMTIGQWVATHPPLLKRMAALDPTLAPDGPRGSEGVGRALLIVGTVVAVLAGVGWVGAKGFARFVAEVNRQTALSQQQRSMTMRVDPTGIVWADLGRLRAFVLVETAAGATPATERVLYERWAATHPGDREPRDPYDGQRYGYALEGTHATLYSRGPDGEPNTVDDLMLRIPLPAR